MFLALFLQFSVKKRGYVNLAQFIQGILTPAGYAFFMPVVMYTAKEYFDTWDEQPMTFVRVWYHFEIIFFFCWLCSIILYLQLTFWSKAQPIYKNEDNLLEDDNVWNDKNTEDYLRWHKYESFKICF